MKRRDFIALVGGSAATWPFPAQAQQHGPVVGFLDSRSPEALADRLRGFRQGLKDAGYVDGENLTIAYRWAENQFNRLPLLSDELVRRQVAVIAASGGPAAVLAAKAATTNIPIVFLSAEDPVKAGFVTSLSRPDGNMTGVNFFNRELAPKQLELLRELVPGATRVAALVNRADAIISDSTISGVERAARALGLQVKVVDASTSREIDAVFEMLSRERPDALFVGGDPFLNARRVQLSLAAMRYGIPAMYSGREATEAGGLISYGSDIADAYRQMGLYAGRILKGAKPADLPVIQSTKFELVINHQTARMLKIKVPQTLLTAADEVIE